MRTYLFLGLIFALASVLGAVPVRVREQARRTRSSIPIPNPSRSESTQRQASPYGEKLHAGVSTILSHLDANSDHVLSTRELGAFYSALRQRTKSAGGVAALHDYVLEHCATSDAGCTANREDGIHVHDLIGALPQRLLEFSKLPHQVHLSFTGNTFDTMNVIWMTPVPHPDSSVEYGACGPNNSVIPSMTQPAVNRTYDVGITGWTGTIYQAVMTNLTLGTQYCYRCGSAAGGWSANFTFSTPAAEPKGTTYVTYGDMGTIIPLGWAVSDQITRDMATGDFSAVLHLGDMAYAGTGSTAEFEPVWDLFCDQIEPYASALPYMTVVGNHEHYYNYTSFLTRFSMPKPWGTPSPSTQHVFWFSQQHYLTHFTFMSTEHPYDSKSEQYAWLKADLASAASNPAIKWIVLMGHRPMYSSDTDEYNSHQPGAAFQREIEPLMIQYKVDLYLCGHMHAYERVHPNINGTVKQTGNAYHAPGAPVHILQGTAGVFTDHSWVTPTPDWSASRLSDIGYGQLRVANESFLQYDYYRLSFEDGPTPPNYITDSFTLTK